MSEAATVDSGDSLTLDCAIEEIPRLNLWFDRCGPLLEIDAATLADLKVCVNEVVANVITHGARPGAAIEVRLWRDGAQGCAEVVDSGGPFDPTAAEVRTAGEDLDTETVGGWGIPLMRKLSDGMTYRYEGGRNHTRFVKRRAT